MDMVRTALVVVLTLLLVGCASTAGPAGSMAASSPASSSAASSSAATNPFDEPHTLAATQRLLALIPAPPGAVPETSPPDQLGGPAVGTPSTTSLVDPHEFWRVPLSFTDATAWLNAHPPGGLQRLSTLDGSQNPVRMLGAGYGGGTGVWATGEVDIGIVAVDANTTGWRVDVYRVWEDDQPPLDTMPGPRLHVTVAAGCPAGLGEAGDVTSSGAELASALLPTDVPTGGVLCNYRGPDATGHRTLTVAEADQLAQASRQVSFRHDSGEGAHSCPEDFGALTIVALSYAGRDDVDLWYHSSGCTWISNGRIVLEHSFDRLQGLIIGLT
jgi:hypothetical protein